MRHGRSRSWLGALLVASGVTACGADAPPLTPLPDGIVVHIDQTRLQRSGHVMFLRVENHTEQDIRIEGFSLSSPRFETVTWKGQREVDASYEADLNFMMPPGRCGQGLTAKVEFTYRIGPSGPRRSVAAADDRYGNAADFADRDCAQQTLESAARVTVGTPKVRGVGVDSVLDVPVTLEPTGNRDDVQFAGFGDTVLFSQAPGSPADVRVSLTKSSAPVRLTMKVVPARCDSHALAEDKVGRLFPVKVVAPDLSDDASYFLALDGAQRRALYGFFQSHCG